MMRHDTRKYLENIFFGAFNLCVFFIKNGKPDTKSLFSFGCIEKRKKSFYTPFLRIIYDHGFKQLVVVLFVIDVIVFCGSISQAPVFIFPIIILCVFYMHFLQPTYFYLLN